MIGEYSNVHWTLAEGLRALGHEVVVASGGDSWKNYPRDIDLYHILNVKGHMSFAWRLLKALPMMRGYDIVQLINPVFFEMRAEPHIMLFDYLKRNNKRIVLGAFGMDHYWAKVNRDVRPMRYSDFNIGDKPRTDVIATTDADIWIGTKAEQLCRHVARNADAIVAGLYEYWITYQLAENGTLKNKTRYISYPVVMPGHDGDEGESIIEKERDAAAPIKIFVGISKGRSQYKGTDIMLHAAERVKERYPDRVELCVAEGVPFALYEQMMNESDLILDQLYSYTPAMNALLAMSKGIVCVGGGEPEHYELLGEKELQPIINVEPNEESVYEALENLVLHPERLPILKAQSVEYVKRHHDPIAVAREYEKLYANLLLNVEHVNP